MRKAWLKFWFNDYVRVLGVVLGGHLIITAPYLYGLLSLLGITSPHLFTGCCWMSYLAILAWGLLDNDYSKLEGL